MDKISKISLTDSIIGILILLIINNAQDYKITKLKMRHKKISTGKIFGIFQIINGGSLLWLL